MRKFSFVKLKSFGIRGSFTRLAVDYQHPWDLRKLCKNDLVLVFYAPHNAIGEQVPVPFVIFTLVQACLKYQNITQW